MVAPREMAGPQPSDRLRVIGDFELLRELGRGGMAVVFLARQRSLDRIVALKLLPLERASSRDIERFHREATVLARLRHPHVVPVHAVGDVEGSHYIAMDYVEGPSLADILECVRGRSPAEVTQGAFPWPVDLEIERPPSLGSYVAATCRVGHGIALALEHAHQHGIVHRDVKPGNILIDADGEAQLTDFGLAHVDGAVTLTLSGDFAGTPYYVSPEQIDPRRGVVDGRSDVYSLGATLYQTLTLRPPFEGATPAQVFRDKLLGDPVRARRLNPVLPRELETIVHRCLARAPEERYATAGDLADDLQRFLSFRPIRARRTPAYRRALNLARRHRVPLQAALLAALTVAAGLFGIRTHERRASARSRAVARAEASGEFTTALDAGEIERATAALARLAGLVSEAELAAERGRLDALTGRSLLAEAARKLAALDDLSRAQQSLEEELRREELELRWTYFDEPRRQRLLELRRLVPERATEPDRVLAETETVLAQARDRLERAGQPLTDVTRAFADLYVAWYRHAETRQRAADAATYRAKALEADVERRYQDELCGQGHLDLWPSTTDRFLFRYQEDPARPGRLVPLPFRTDIASSPTPALEVLELSEGSTPVRPGDLILSIADEPATSGLLVEWVGSGSLAQSRGVEPYSRLLSINDQPIAGTADWSWPFDQKEVRQRALIRTPAGDQLLEAPANRHPNHAFGLFPQPPWLVLDHVAPPHPLPITLLRNGVEMEVELPSTGGARIVARPTTYPLVRCDAARIARDARSLTLPPGSYVLMCEREVRVAFRIRAGQTVTLSSPSEPRAPPGYRLIPKGPFPSGGDELAIGQRAHEQTGVDDFYLCEHEVTAAEWFEFLNDPEVKPRAVEELARSGAQLLPVNSLLGARMVSYDRPKDRLIANLIDRAPIIAISRSEAREYLAWLSRKLAAQGFDLTADLPSSIEWEKAARGGDDRAYPWGSTFDPHAMNSLFSRPGKATRNAFSLEPVMAYLDDESPYGIYDLAGGVQEWTSDTGGAAGSSAFVKGGSYGRRDPAEFRIATCSFVADELKLADVGFRVALHGRSR